MPARKKTAKKAGINLNNKVMFIGGQAYKLHKLSKKDLQKGQAEKPLGSGSRKVKKTQTVWGHDEDEANLIL